MTNFDFVGRRAIWFGVSALVIAVGIVAILTKGLTFGIEFEGGTLFEARFDKPVRIEQVREAITPAGLKGAVIQQGGNTKVVFIKTPELDQKERGEVESALKKIGAADFAVQEVGASWGARLTSGTIVALVVAVAIVLVFVALRFEFKMGMAAVVALIHDILIAVGIYALVGREVTTATIAAFLTILGYSIYDTIVIFDRIRENAGLLKSQKTYSDMVNESVNQTLRRSINTSAVSIIPVLSLLFFGGETLKDFAFALFVGLGSGAYSSVFIASPVLAMLKEREPKYIALRKKLSKTG